MDEVIHRLRTNVRGLKKAIGRNATKQIRANSVKEKVRSLVRDYFDKVRPALGSRDDVLKPVDDEMQNILRYTHKATVARSYQEAIKRLSEAINDVESVALTATRDESAKGIADEDRRIIATLKQICPSAALSYEQGLRDLPDEARVSWRGTATEFREALRETLDKMAPDEEVISTPGFKYEKDQNRPTMRQKAKYILKSRNIPENAVNAALDATNLVEEYKASLVRSVYTRSSISTHTSTDKTEVAKIKNYVSSVLADLLEVQHY